MAWRPSDDDAGGATVSLRSVKEALKLTGIELSDDDAESVACPDDLITPSVSSSARRA